MHRRSLLVSAAASIVPPGVMAQAVMAQAVMAQAVMAQAGGLTVFAAASLTEVMGDIDRLWIASGHAKLRSSFASSSTLARQIEQGAPADVFASADEQWADYLQQRGLLVAGTRHDLLTNSLVLVVAKAGARTVSIGPGMDLGAILGADGRLAVGDPAHVPAGIYAKQALAKLALWQQAEPRLARAEDVRGALLLVERGEAPAGIVYATDVAVSPALAIAGTFPPESHDPITYPFALVKGGDRPESRAFLAFLSGPKPARRSRNAASGYASTHHQWSVDLAVGWISAAPSTTSRAIGGWRYETGQEFYCGGHPTGVFCAPMLTTRVVAALRCSKTPAGRRQAAPLTRRSEFLPSLYAYPPDDRRLALQPIVDTK